MSDQVVQWLNEIKDLKQQLQTAQAAQNAADASADNWRKRYETEAQQRRTEVMLTRQTIDTLKLEISQLKNQPQPSADVPILQSGIERAIETLETVADLKLKLLEVWTERDRLAQELKIEQANHVQTRKNLTTALGDTIDMLTKQQKSES
ncbi:MAG: hypothetical protein HC780_00505 [Leptolyngbyaceae cyanobacterium CSU_1_3]|nr:hypothetical protein [Leptolyngbyaceae cyanobacterium CSU_1_3]